MDESQFVDRIAKIRARFASKLSEKIQETDAALPHMTGAGSEAADTVAIVYRRIHEVCGMGATVGFEATGRVAHTLDTLLLEPYRDHRGLSDDEMVRLKEGLHSLRIAARTELQSLGLNGGLSQ